MTHLIVHSQAPSALARPMSFSITTRPGPVLPIDTHRLRYTFASAPLLTSCQKSTHTRSLCIIPSTCIRPSIHSHGRSTGHRHPFSLPLLTDHTVVAEERIDCARRVEGARDDDTRRTRATTTLTRRDTSLPVLSIESQVGLSGVVCTARQRRRKL